MIFEVGQRVFVPYVKQYGVIEEVRSFPDDNECQLYVQFSWDPIMIWGEWFSSYEVTNEQI